MTDPEPRVADKHRLGIYIDPALYKRLCHRAVDLGTTVSELCRWYITAQFQPEAVVIKIVDNGAADTPDQYQV